MQISDVEKINPLFSKAKIRVLYTGLNRNNTYFSKEAVEKAIPSIYNIPIVGEFLENADNFGGHGGKIEISDDDIKWIQTTKPYGVVAESAEIYWETVQENDGSEHEYLVIDGAYLWSGRYEELNDVVAQSYEQSMESKVQKGDFAKGDGAEAFKIDYFLVSALCILGVNKNGEGHVEPCFESASIMTYSLNKDEFTEQFNLLVAELKTSLSKGGYQMDEVVQEKVEEVVETVELTEEQSEDVVELETEIQEESFEVTEEVAEEVESVEEKVEEIEEVDFKLLYENSQLEIDQLKVDFASLKDEVEGLRNYKSTKESEERQVAETELFERFSSELTEDEVLAVKTTSKDFSLDQLEEKLFVLVGKTKATFSKQVKREKQSIKVEVELDQQEVKPKPYGDLFDKFATE